MKLNKLTKVVALSLATMCAPSAFAEQLLIENVDVFNGTDNKLYNDLSVLIEDGKIKAIASSVKADDDAVVIDGKGKTLMPGMIDVHSHICFFDGLTWGRDHWDATALGAMMSKNMRGFLQQGFTTTRDTGCNTLGISKAQRLGHIEGPRVFSSGGFLSQTGGHADLGPWSDKVDSAKDAIEQEGVGHIADGRAEVLKAVRHNFRNGATQIKIMGGGGVSSEFDPIHTVQYQPEEYEAIVKVAADYGSYATVHAYHDASVNRAIDAGVKTIEHAFLITEPTVKRMAEEGVMWSLQAEMSYTAFAKPELITFFTPDQQNKARAMFEGVKRVAKLMRKYKVKTATGGDMFGTAYQNRQADNVIVTTTGLGYSNFEALQMTTKNAGELVALSGELNPWREAKLGVVEVGAWGDVIIVDGDPLKDITALKSDKVKLVVQGGKVHKNTL